MARSSRGLPRSSGAALGASAMLMGTLLGLTERPAEAAVTSVRGEACAYAVNVGLFGGPQGLQGCGEAGRAPSPSPAPGAADSSYSPHVRISGGGGSMTATDSDGAKAQYGPAVIHGGKWPCSETGDRNCPSAAPPSGPQRASTSGSAASGTVTSSADISLHPAPVPVPCYTGYGPSCYSTGGFGPFPAEGDSLHVECTATEAAVTGSTTLSNAMLAISTDAEGSPVVLEPVPNNPPVNYTRSGVITNVGDVFTVVYNQQIVNPDGSLTVNGIHMYLFGPTAVGELIRGQVTCGTTPSPLAPSDTVAPTCGTPVVKPLGPDDPTPQSPRSELVGTFDAGGIQSVTNVQVTNGTVQVGADPDGDPSNPNDDPLPYLVFTQGQTGPLAVTATRTAAAEAAGLAMIWSFDVTDLAGNKTHCRGFIPGEAPGDFDGNGTTDVSVYRPSNGQWYVQSPFSVVTWGVPGDIPVPGDYDGNGTTEHAVFRPSNGFWYLLGSSPRAVLWGQQGDVPVPADYDGNGTTDVAIFRPSNGLWYIQSPFSVTLWGQPGDIPVPGDYDGNGTADIAVYRPAGGLWYVLSPFSVAAWGAPGDIPVPGDYDGNGTTDIAVFRPAGGLWYVRSPFSVVGGWGQPGDIPVPGDYDGNGRTEPAVYRPSNGIWYLRSSIPSTTLWGVAGDIPLPLPQAIYRSFF